MCAAAREQLEGVSLSFSHMGSENQTQVGRLHDKCLYSLSHFIRHGGISFLKDYSDNSRFHLPFDLRIYSSPVLSCASAPWLCSLATVSQCPCSRRRTSAAGCRNESTESAPPPRLFAHQSGHCCLRQLGCGFWISGDTKRGSGILQLVYKMQM